MSNFRIPQSELCAKAQRAVEGNFDLVTCRKYDFWVYYWVYKIGARVVWRCFFISASLLTERCGAYMYVCMLQLLVCFK